MQWLLTRDNSNDETGWFLRYWRDLPDHPRLSSPDSIRKHLEQRGLFTAQEGLSQAFDATIEAYRLSRVDMATRPAQPVLPGMEAAAAVPSAAPATLEGLAETLAVMDHKLTMIMTALGIKGGLRPEQAMIMPPPPALPGEPYPAEAWASWFATADHAAELEA
jgi:hypothetical protein